MLISELKFILLYKKLVNVIQTNNFNKLYMFVKVNYKSKWYFCLLTNFNERQ